ncbi:MAG: alpha-L-fucosidase C-terminal domain-containing protein, partial [Bacteroidales bacterium]|nr:alpha-L-fucosidase C-terminal domain-containing protein [Bacteroidales bacterium]
PWKKYGEGPSTLGGQEKGHFGGLSDVRPYQTGDIRFTTKGQTLYAFCMSNPTDNIRISSLAKNAQDNGQEILSVNMLGSDEKIVWNRNEEALMISKPSGLPKWQVVTFKIEFRK